MTLLDRLLSVLGLRGATDEPETAEPAVTVEHEPDVGDEAAVKGVDVGSDATEDADDDSGADLGTDDGTDAAGADDGPDATETDDRTAGTDAASVEDVKGIGPAYAGKLGKAGVETVDDLAAADPDELAEQTSLSPKRVGRWIERARARRDP